MLEDFTARILLTPLVALLGLFFALLFNGIDRRLAARMQARIGPPIRQPFIDLKKLLMKENIVPDTAVKWVFNLMPVIALTASLLLLLYIPLFGLPPLFSPYSDIILIMYVLLIPALALVLGGFSSGSPYASIGAQRETVLMMSYEFALAVVAVSIAWIFSVFAPGSNGFSLAVVSTTPVWALVGPIGWLGLLLLFVSLLMVMPAELGRIPADIAEAKTEIADGILVEYSGVNLALLHLAQFVRTFAFASIIVALFLPWNLSDFAAMNGITALTANALFFLLKAFIVMFVGAIFISVAVARFKVDQAARAYWGPVVSIALLGLALVAFEMVVA